MLKSEYFVLGPKYHAPAIKYKNSENLEYLESKFMSHFLKGISLEYKPLWDIPAIRAIILLYVYDPNKIYREFIHRAINHPANLKLCIRLRPIKELWCAKYMYRLYVIKAFQDLQDNEVELFRYHAFNMVIEKLRDTSVKCMTVDRYYVQMEDKIIWFNMMHMMMYMNRNSTDMEIIDIYDDFDFTERIEFTFVR